MELAWFRRHRAAVRVLAAVLPLAAAALLHLGADLVPNSAAALVLVLFVVAAAATGDRLAGVLAAVASAVGFDFFLTRPYFELRIDDVEDVELAAGLLLVGLAVSELASWGIRQSATANRQASFVQGALESAALAGGSLQTDDALERGADAIAKVLEASAVEFVYGDHDATVPVIHPDGSVRRHGREIDVPAAGFPAAAYAAIPVAQRGAQVGFFRIATDPPLRPTREQLRVAALLAGLWSARPIPQRRRELRHPAASELD